MRTGYDFGYSWLIGYGLVIPLGAGAVFAVLAIWRRWSRWVIAASGALMVWAATGLVLSMVAFGLNRPMELPTPKFLSAGRGRVLDVGAGSGRAAIGVLLARPAATAVGIDIYRGYWGIDDNTPERFMYNARVAGVADRAEARVGDARELPLEDATFDAAVSSFAIDHLPRAGQPKALAEVARVLQPGGQFLLLIVNADWMAWLVSPHAIAHHPRQDPTRWRAMLEQAGFVIEEEGTRPATRYWLTRKHR